MCEGSRQQALEPRRTYIERDDAWLEDTAAVLHGQAGVALADVLGVNR